MLARRLLLLCMVTIGLPVGVGVSQAQVKPDQPGTVSPGDTLIGAWRLVSVETIRPSGEVIYPFYGKHPEGLIVYDRSGWMSVQIVSDPQPTVPRASSREEFVAAAPAEKVAAVEGYYSYYGTWTVDPSTSTVTHHIKQSLYPAERGEEGIRHFVLDGDHLTLIAKTHEMGEDHERKLVWQRVQKDKP
ncbi:MAG: lipocalin-like domain-containing protein [Acidobacteriia bacterium]|nr:lipocalin-like domain-containing protein [Terriglobia bacterium]